MWTLQTTPFNLITLFFISSLLSLVQATAIPQANANPNAQYPLSLDSSSSTSSTLSPCAKFASATTTQPPVLNITSIPDCVQKCSSRTPNHNNVVVDFVALFLALDANVPCCGCFTSDQKNGFVAMDSQEVEKSGACGKCGSTGSAWVDGNGDEVLCGQRLKGEFMVSHFGLYDAYTMLPVDDLFLTSSISGN
ncbi:hypothetical protein HDU76_012756 [Blyttiomyces sp. JEL0837]|nr:hypothetical protein HDU76_012756 [Blyttiomyces sp. JEL0837]